MIDQAWSNLVARRGRTRSLVIFLVGLLAGLAFAPAYLVPLWPLGFGLTLGLIYRSQTWRMRLWLSFLFSYGYMLSSLYWISLAPTADPQFYFIIPFALVLLPAATALFGTLALFLAGFWRRNPVEFGFLAAALWMFFEWRRGVDLTGFAWNRVGMIWTVDPVTMQLAALGGVPLLSAISVLLGLGVFLALTQHRRFGLGLILLPTFALLIFGSARLALTPLESQDTLPDVNVRLVQANIPKNSRSGSAIYEEHLRLSANRDLDQISHVIWPEGSIRDHLDINPGLRGHLAQNLSPAPFSLVFGRREAVPGVGHFGPTHLSAYLIDHERDAFETYDKSQLVPFGEYIPYQDIFGRLGFSALTGQFFGRVPGAGPTTLDLEGSPAVGVFICYDSIFTGQIVDQEDRPEWLATITEDAWYILPEIPLLAKTPGPYQHLAESRLRAVEEGLSVARASNPGISMVIDPYGRSWSETLRLGDRGTLDSTIPKALPRPVYSRVGPLLWYIGLSLFFLIVTFFYKRIARL